jgi:hypothetical protein
MKLNISILITALFLFGLSTFSGETMWSGQAFKPEPQNLFVEGRKPLNATSDFHPLSSGGGLNTPANAQSTSGPLPPPNLDPGFTLKSPDAAVTLNVPAYLWYRGCGPTAAGMVLGYWDGNGYPNLVSGSAATQTTAVNAMISSTGNYNDYCLPLDYAPAPILADLSEPPIGDEHADDSIADFMFTSQSIRNNYYGWSWFSHMEYALEDYVENEVPEYIGSAANKTFGNLSWEDYKAEIDAGRPVVFLVDSNGDGGTDHFVPGIGYDENGDTHLYACWDTWYYQIRWEEYAQMASGQSWGIYGASLFEIDDAPPPPGVVVINEVEPSAPDIIELFNAGGQATDMTGWLLVVNDLLEYTFLSFSLQPGAYVVIQEFGNSDNDTETSLYTEGNLNFASTYGAVGLVNNGFNGVDFVRWGTSIKSPPNPTAWTGVNPPAVPTNRTLGRDSASTDTDDGDDWYLEMPSLGFQNDEFFRVYLPLIIR